jgi:hypothetical protein
MGAAFFNIACRVARDIARIIAPENMSPERWREALFGEFDHTPIRSEVFLANVFDIDGLESRGFEKNLGFGRRDQLCPASVQSPRNGMIWIANRSNPCSVRAKGAPGFSTRKIGNRVFSRHGDAPRLNRQRSSHGLPMQRTPPGSRFRSAERTTDGQTPGCYVIAKQTIAVSKVMSASKAAARHCDARLQSSCFE